MTRQNKIKIYLSQPYPFYYRVNNLWIIAGLLFVLTITFNYIFKPFNVYVPEHKFNYFWISFIHACSPALIIGLFSIYPTKPKTEENWSVQKEIILIAFFLLLVGIAQFLIRDFIYNNPNNWSCRYLYEEIRNAFLIGSLFAVLLTSLNHNRLNKKHIKNANAINLSQKVKKAETYPSVLITTQLKSDDFILNLDSFLFAKAEGNYVVLFLNEHATNKLIKRITLKELEKILTPYSNIKKTHRSYLVNLHQIKSVTGNAQGYKLELKNCHEKIPVSRNMIKEFESKFNAV